ncbi:MAG: uroporphyrinogen-III synthase [Actinomycetota bacterium]|nr:MAG: uroporphyrinogen-III synthase [Actinomycetota bacterium]
MASSVPAAPTVAPLAGYTVGITAARRREELGSLLERRGARVVYGPSIRIVPLADDAELLAATRQCVSAPPDIVIATTGIGMRGWLEAAEGWGLAEDLLDRLGRVRLLARGPKARGALRAAGLREEWSPESESSSEVLEHLLTEDLDGVRIVVQEHGEPLPGVTETLRMAGARVVEVPVYRWLPPVDPGPLHRLVEQIATRQLDAVTFTSAPAAASLLATASRLGLYDEVVTALRDDVLVASVGPITAGALESAGIESVVPERSRLGALAREVVAALPRRSPRLPVAGHWLQIRGHAVVVDDDLRTLPPAPMAILRALAARPGVVLPRTVLRTALPGGEDADDHAVEVAIARLRQALGEARLLQTVVKRGYRLAYEPERRVTAGSHDGTHEA